eukprot:40711-Rhodomonas_salina.1
MLRTPLSRRWFPLRRRSCRRGQAASAAARGVPAAGEASLEEQSSASRLPPHPPSPRASPRMPAARRRQQATLRWRRRGWAGRRVARAAPPSGPSGLRLRSSE